MKDADKLADELEAKKEAELTQLVDNIFKLQGDHLVAGIVDFQVEQFKRKPKPWGQLKEAEQRSLITGARFSAEQLVKRVIHAVAAGGQVGNGIKAVIESYKDAGQIITATVKISCPEGEEGAKIITALHANRGKPVVMTRANLDDFNQGEETAKPEPDQRELAEVREPELVD